MTDSLRDDERWMRRALGLAEAAVGLASPNPVVGCCLVRDGVLLGEGAHRYDARDHAEIVALKAAAAEGVSVEGATAYVTLEPCSHHGRTGPCADALVGAGIGRCVVATVDANPEVSGRGLAKLRAAGIEVRLGVLEREARALNDGFARFIQSGVPLVTLKAALSVDGRLAPTPAGRVPGESFWLTGAEARTEVQGLRHSSDAILVGIGTVLADDPLLTDRSGRARRRPLLRVVLDAGLKMPLGSKLVKSASADLVVFCAGAQEKDNTVGGNEGLAARVGALEASGVELIRVGVDHGRLRLREVLAELGRRRILNLLVEGGSAVNGSFLGEGLVDKAVLYYAETELGEGAVPFAEGLASPFRFQERMQRVETRMVGADVRVSGYLRDPWAGVP